jgi:hypothetical protein
MDSDDDDDDASGDRKTEQPMHTIVKLQDAADAVSVGCVSSRVTENLAPSPNYYQLLSGATFDALAIQMTEMAITH